MAAKKKAPPWIKDATKNKGALRKQLGVKEDEPIPEEDLEEKEGDSAKTKKRKSLAKTLKKINKNKSKK